MTVTVTWFDPANSIIHYKLEPGWSWKTFYPAFEQALAMEQSVAHRVDVILELPMPVRLQANTITHIAAIARKQPHNLRKSVFVSDDPLVNRLLHIARRISPVIERGYVCKPTLDEALAYIQADRASGDRDRVG